MMGSTVFIYLYTHSSILYGIMLCVRINDVSQHQVQILIRVIYDTDCRGQSF